MSMPKHIWYVHSRHIHMMNKKLQMRRLNVWEVGMVTTFKAGDTWMSAWSEWLWHLATPHGWFSKFSIVCKKKLVNSKLKRFSVQDTHLIKSDKQMIVIERIQKSFETASSSKDMESEIFHCKTILDIAGYNQSKRFPSYQQIPFVLPKVLGFTQLSFTKKSEEKTRKKLKNGHQKNTRKTYIVWPSP